MRRFFAGCLLLVAAAAATLAGDNESDGDVLKGKTLLAGTLSSKQANYGDSNSLTRSSWSEWVGDASLLRSDVEDASGSLADSQCRLCQQFASQAQERARRGPAALKKMLECRDVNEDLMGICKVIGSSQFSERAFSSIRVGICPRSVCSQFGFCRATTCQKCQQLLLDSYLPGERFSDERADELDQTCSRLNLLPNVISMCDTAGFKAAVGVMKAEGVFKANSDVALRACRASADCNKDDVVFSACKGTVTLSRAELLNPHKGKVYRYQVALDATLQNDIGYISSQEKKKRERNAQEKLKLSGATTVSQ